MKPLTGLALIQIASAIGVLIALGVVWSPWAAALLVSYGLLSAALDAGRKSLDRGGE